MTIRNGVLAIGLAAMIDAHAIEIMQWERIPLAIPLVVGKERIVFVNQNVRVGMPQALLGKLRIQSTGGTVYLLAEHEIPPTRLQLQNVATGEIMLVDIAATSRTDGRSELEPVKIVPGVTPATRYGRPAAPVMGSTASMLSAEEDEENTPAPPRHETPAPVALTRYAAQMLYAPLRTVEPVKGISQARIDRQMDLSTLLPVLPVEASALGAWKLGDTYVTAVKLRNLSEQQLAMNPTDLMGNFVTATYQHPYLGAHGNASDTTTLYLVTKGRNLKQTLPPSSISQVVSTLKGGRGHDADQ